MYLAPPTTLLNSTRMRMTEAQRIGDSIIPAPSLLQRHVEPSGSWTEPERRKYRFRLEDVAFD